MIKIGDLVKQERNIDNINVEFYGKVSKIEKIKSKLVDENGLYSSELFEITYEPNLDNLDENEIEYLIRFLKSLKLPHHQLISHHYHRYLQMEL